MAADDPTPIPTPADPAAPPTTRRRRWWSLSLRGLMILVLLIGGLIGWEVDRVGRMRRAIAVLRTNPDDSPEGPPGDGRVLTIGGRVDRAEVMYDDERWDGRYVPASRPAWLDRVVGGDHFHRVSAVRLARRPTPADWAALASFPALQELDLNGIDLGDDDLAGLANCPHLRELSLGSTEATDRVMPRVGALRDLRVLDLRQTVVTATGLAPVARLARLEELHLDDRAANDAGLAHLAGLANLRVLDAWGLHAEVSDVGLAHLRGLAQLEEFRCHARGVTDAGVATLVALPWLRALQLNPSFEHLDEAFRLTPAGVEQLGRFPRLEELTLDAMLQADDSWVRAIARIGTLRRLEITGQQITDTGLAPLGGLTKLEELRISSPKVTDAGLAHLEPLASLTRLSFYARVTPEGAARFGATHPKLGPIRTDPWPSAPAPGDPNYVPDLPFLQPLPPAPPAPPRRGLPPGP